MWDAEKKIEAGNRNTIVSGGIALWTILRHGIQYQFATHIAKKTVFEFPINGILNNAAEWVEASRFIGCFLPQEMYSQGDTRSR